MAEQQAVKEAKKSAVVPKKPTETVREAFQIETADNLMWHLVQKGGDSIAKARVEAGERVCAEAESRGLALQDILSLPANSFTRKEVERITELDQKILEAIESSREAISALLDRAQVLKLKQTAKQIQEESKKRKKTHDEGVERLANEKKALQKAAGQRKKPRKSDSESPQVSEASSTTADHATPISDEKSASTENTAGDSTENQ
jgi:hypothetical protein